ncbi:MAG: CRTAC1 family protein [Acidobacteriota bacterium]|nr:CRTAC1 family protein [Acidobacteriota bacterium]
MRAALSSLLSLPFLFLAALLSQNPPAVPPIRFHDVAREAGLRFTLENSPTPRKRMIETMPGGVAAFDYDNDGLPDIYFTNGAAIPSLKKESPKYFNRLFHNDGQMKFRDVTEAAGVAGEGYSMGVAAADYDNDGFADLFIAGVHRNILYRNLGNGKFEDVSVKSGIKSDEWSVAAGWFDFDNDGLLDLFVVNYGKWSLSFDRFCGDSTRGLRIYCHPKYFEERPNQLYRNRGDGTFEDVSASSGIASHPGRGMSVAFADYDGDGLMDVFVTNDNLPNSLFHNLGKGKFEEVALLSGVALLDHGKAVAGMGADFRDYDNDGLPDIAVTALNGETFPVFHNDGKGSFHDATYSSHIAQLSVTRAGWANAWLDFNNDGWKDLFTANAHVNDLVEKVEAAVYKQANAVFANLQNGKFEDARDPELAAAAKAHRGAAFADFDNDGRVDVVVSALGEPAELWRNVSRGAGHWLDVKLTGTKSNRDGIGAVVRIGKQSNHMTTAVGYASSSRTGVHFGLGNLAVVPKIEIRWPSGRTQTLENVNADRTIAITEQ